MKMRQMVAIATVTFPVLAHAQTNAELKTEIDILKAQIDELKSMMAKQSSTPAPPPTASTDTVDPEEFNKMRVKVEAMEDQRETAGLKGFRISGGIDPTYIYNRNKGTRSFAFLNNSSDVNGSGEVASYDNSYFGLAYLDFQKEMDDNGTRFRLTLSPSKSSGSAYNWGNIVHEASASIPLDGPATRLVIGQIPDVSGYEPFFNTYAGANGISSNQLYPGYAQNFITRNLLFDFTGATFYTGVGLELARGSWDWRFYLANFNSARNDVSSVCPLVGAGNSAPTNSIDCSSLRSSKMNPAFIYNATFSKDEFSGFEFTGYEGNVTNANSGITSTPSVSRLDQFEIDGNFTRGNFNTNVQFTLGQQKYAAFNGGDSAWWGVSWMLSQNILPKFTLAARLDYLNNRKNGGGTFNITPYYHPTGVDDGTGSGTRTYAHFSDYYNGFGPGDPSAPGYDPNEGANRAALAISGTYRLTPYASLRAEIRYDMSNKYSFYDFQDQSFRKTNYLLGFSTIVNF